MTPHALTSSRELEAAVGARPSTHHLKSIADLDAHCHTILAASPLPVVGARAGDGTLHLTTLGGQPGTVSADGPTRLRLPGLSLDVPTGAAAASLAVVPGYGETLRVNGRLAASGDVGIEVEEAFLHCAKAVIRSGLWSEATPSSGPTPGPTSLADPDAVDFLARSPFVVLASVDGEDEADVSPKGDPAGFVRLLDDRTVVIPDRPGNRRTDTLHNLLAHSSLSLLALVPGDHRALELRGHATITDDEALRADMTVNGKAPKAAIVLTVDDVELRAEPALAAAHLWDTSRHVEPGTLPRGATVWVDHVKRNDDPGLKAKAARGIVNERMMRAGIDRDYRDNLY